MPRRPSAGAPPLCGALPAWPTGMRKSSAACAAAAAGRRVAVHERLADLALHLRSSGSEDVSYHRDASQLVTACWRSALGRGRDPPFPDPTRGNSPSGQSATIPSPPTAPGTVTVPIGSSAPSAVIAKASTFPVAPAWT